MMQRTWLMNEVEVNIYVLCIDLLYLFCCVCLMCVLHRMYVPLCIYTTVYLSDSLCRFFAIATATDTKQKQTSKKTYTIGLVKPEKYLYVVFLLFVCDFCAPVLLSFLKFVLHSGPHTHIYVYIHTYNIDIKPHHRYIQNTLETQAQLKSYNYTTIVIINQFQSYFIHISHHVSHTHTYHHSTTSNCKSSCIEYSLAME